MTLDLAPAMAQMTITAAKQPTQVMQHFNELLINACNIGTAPTEMAVRPRFGTRYINPLSYVLGLAMFWTVYVLSIVFSAFAGSGPMTTFGNAVIGLAFVGGCLYHGFRVWRHIIRNDEVHSEMENDGWCWLGFLPGGQRFTMQRIVWEPLIVFSAALLLKVIGFLNLALMLYFMLAAVALAVKACLVYMLAWNHQRDILDKTAILPFIEKMAAGKPVPEKIGRMVTTSIAQTAKPAERAAIAARVSGLDPAMVALLSPVQK